MKVEPDPTLARELHRLWDMSRASPDYVEEPWIGFHTELLQAASEITKLRLELSRFHQVRTIIQELILNSDENVPRPFESFKNVPRGTA